MVVLLCCYCKPRSEPGWLPACSAPPKRWYYWFVSEHVTNHEVAVVDVRVAVSPTHHVRLLVAVVLNEKTLDLRVWVGEGEEKRQELEEEEEVATWQVDLAEFNLHVSQPTASTSSPQFIFLISQSFLITFVHLFLPITTCKSFRPRRTPVWLF